MPLIAAKLLRRLARGCAAQNLVAARLPDPRHLAQREGLAGSRIAFYQRQRRRRQHRLRGHPLIRRQAAAGQQTDAGRVRPEARDRAGDRHGARQDFQVLHFGGPRRGDVLRLAIGAVLHQTHRRARAHCLAHQSRKLCLRQHQPVLERGYDIAPGKHRPLRLHHHQNMLRVLLQIERVGLCHLRVPLLFARRHALAPRPLGDMPLWPRGSR